MAVVKISQLNELTTLTPPDLFLVSDTEASVSNRVSFASLQANIEVVALKDVDVDVNSVQEGQALAWNSATNKFEPRTISSTITLDNGQTIDLSPYDNLITLLGTSLAHLGDHDVLPDNSTVQEVVEAIDTELESVDVRVSDVESEVTSVRFDLTNTLNSLSTTVTNLETTLSTKTLGDLSNVIANNPSVGEVLKWDGSNWASQIDETSDLSNYYTKSEVDTEIAGVTVDLSGYYTKTEIDAAGYLVSSDLSTYYTKTEVDSAIAGATGTDLSNYYTKAEVDTAVAGVTVDLSGYYTKTEIDNAGFLTSFSLGDGEGLELGDDVDLKLYYDGTLGVQTSFLESDALIVRSKTNQEEYITAIEDGPVELYYDGSKKFGTSADGVTVLGDLEVDGKVYFKNVFSTEGDLPNATTYHGMFAHVHGTGAAYYAHAGNWVKLANDVDIPDLTGYATEAFVNTQVSGLSVPSDLGDLGDVNISGTPTTGHVLKWDGSNWAPAADGGGGGGGISLQDLSVTTNAVAGGSGALAYNNITGVFTFTQSSPSVGTFMSLSDVDSSDTPAGDDIIVYSATDSKFKLENLSSVVSSLTLQNITDAVYGVDVAGKIATTDGIDIGSGGNINAALTSIDFQGATINFGSAIISGLGTEIRSTVDTHLNQSAATDGQVLAWDASANAGNGDYTWTTPSTGGGGGGATTLDALTDVSTANVSTGRILEYNGTSWVTSEAVIQLQEFQQNILANTAVSNLSFTANNTAGSSPMSVTLSTSYTGNANTFDVDWGDGTQDTGLSSNQLNHTYNNASGGLFDITMTASNSAGVGFGSNAVSNREDYIVLYTPQPIVEFDLRQVGNGPKVSGNDRWVLAGSPFYVENESTNSVGVNAEFVFTWGDGLTDIIASDNSSGGANGGPLPHTYTSAGWYNFELKLTAHDATDPSYLNSTKTDNIKVYDTNPSAPTGLSGKLNDVGGSSATLASGFTDNTGGLKNAGDSVKRFTSGSMQTSMSSYAYNAESGKLSSVRNGITNGAIFMDQPHNQYLTDGELALNGESDYQLLTSAGGSTSFANGTFYPGLYKGFKARTITNYTAAAAGLNVVKLSHSETGDSNERFFLKDTSVTPTLDGSSSVITEQVSGAKKFISGIPYYSATNTTIRVEGLVVDDLTTECYNASQPVNLTSDSVSQGGTGNPVQNTTYSYSQVEGTTPLLDGSVPFANVTAYTLGGLNIFPQNNSTGSRKLRVRATNVNGYGSYETLPTIIQTFTRDQNVMDIDEQDITVSTSLGNGSLTDGGVRILDFVADTTDTPAFNGAVDFYTHNLYSESVDPMVSGSREASLIYGDIEHNTTDYSTGYLPVGPDRSGDTGTQYFTFAFRRQVVANFNIRINTGGIAGCWIAAPGTAIDSTSGLNGWLDTSQSYAGSGVPGSNTGAGGNGSDGCATNNSSRILSNTSMNGTYTMTLGEENMSNATGNVVLVRIALNSGQSISTLEVN